jgi:hypothetical protein
VFWPLVKAGHAPLPWDRHNKGEEPDEAIINLLKMLEIRISQQQ